MTPKTVPEVGGTPGEFANTFKFRNFEYPNFRFFLANEEGPSYILCTKLHTCTGSLKGPFSHKQQQIATYTVCKLLFMFTKGEDVLFLIRIA